MAVTVFTVNVTVIVYKVLVSGIIRWVNINNVYFPFVRVGKCCKSFKIIALYDYVIWITI